MSGLKNFLDTSREMTSRFGYKMAGLAIGTFMSIMPFTAKEAKAQVGGGSGFHPYLGITYNDPYFNPNLNEQKTGFEAISLEAGIAAMMNREGLTPSIQFAFTTQPQDDLRVGVEGSIGAVYLTPYNNKIQVGAFGLLTVGGSNHAGHLIGINGQRHHESDAHYGVGGKVGAFVKLFPENNHDMTFSVAFNSAYVVDEIEGLPANTPYNTPRDKGNVNTVEFGFTYRLLPR